MPSADALKVVGRLPLSRFASLSPSTIGMNDGPEMLMNARIIFATVTAVEIDYDDAAKFR